MRHEAVESKKLATHIVAAIEDIRKDRAGEAQRRKQAVLSHIPNSLRNFGSTVAQGFEALERCVSEIVRRQGALHEIADCIKGSSSCEDRAVDRLLSQISNLQPDERIGALEQTVRRQSIELQQARDWRLNAENELRESAQVALEAVAERNRLVGGPRCLETPRLPRSRVAQGERTGKGLALENSDPDNKDAEATGIEDSPGAGPEALGHGLVQHDDVQEILCAGSGRVMPTQQRRSKAKSVRSASGVHDRNFGRGLGKRSRVTRGSSTLKERPSAPKRKPKARRHSRRVSEAIATAIRASDDDADAWDIQQ